MESLSYASLRRGMEVNDMPDLKFGIEFVPQDVYWRTVAYGILAEKGGFEHIWVTDHFNNRNVHLILGLIANYTERIKLGTGVTNPYLNNPAAIASAILTLDEVSGGRAILGIGAGDKITFSYLGVEWKKPLAAIRETVEVFRRLIRGESVSYEGEFVRLRNARLNFKTKGEIPVYIGAQGPKMLELAGEIGDGILINASHPKDFERAMLHIQKGLEKSRRARNQIDIAAYTSFSVHKDSNKAKDAARPVVAFIVAGAPKGILEFHEIPYEKASEIGRKLSKGKFKEAFSMVSDEMLSAFSVCGSPDECIDKIRELQKAGISQLVAGSPIGPNVKAAIELISKEIMPVFR